MSCLGRLGLELPVPTRLLFLLLHVDEFPRFNSTSQFHISIQLHPRGGLSHAASSSPDCSHRKNQPGWLWSTLRLKSWVLNFMDREWRPPHDLTAPWHHPWTVCVLEGQPRSAKPLPSGPHVLECNAFKFVKSRKWIKIICDYSAVVQDLIVTIGHIGLVRLRRINPRISSHLKGREASSELPASSDWI